MENNRQFKGIWIPAEIWEDERLSALERALWAEIDSFSRGERGCMASDAYLAKFLGVSDGHAKKLLGNLRKLELIKTVSFDGRTRFMKSIVPAERDTTAVSEMIPQQYPKWHSLYKDDRKAYKKEEIVEQIPTVSAIARVDNRNPAVQGIMDCISEAHGSVDGLKAQERRAAHNLAQRLVKGWIPEADVAKIVREVLRRTIESGKAFEISLTTKPSSIYRNWARLGANLKACKAKEICNIEAL